MGTEEILFDKLLLLSFINKICLLSKTNNLSYMYLVKKNLTRLKNPVDDHSMSVTG